jgi:hypothetical protein
MQEYNWFSGQYRMKVNTIQKKCIKDWYIIEYICQLTGLRWDPSSIHFHCENYDNYLEVHPIAIEPHMILHWRFRSPNLWINYLYKLHKGENYQILHNWFVDWSKHRTFKDNLPNEEAIKWFDSVNWKSEKWYENLKMTKVNRYNLTEEERQLIDCGCEKIKKKIV